MALSKTTQDHEEIRQWAESRGAKPAEVASTERNGQTGIIRLEFPGATNANDSALKEISWDEFFEKFDASGLALVYQEMTADGEKSNFNKLVHPENASPSGRGSKKSSGSAAKKSAGRKSPSKKAPSKVSAKKSSAKSAPPRKSVAKKVAGRSAAKKTPAKSAKKAPAKSAKKVASKSSAKKAPSKSAAKKSAPKKASGAKSVAKKTGRRR